MGVNVFDAGMKMQECQICRNKMADSDAGLEAHYRRFHGVNRSMPMPQREWIPMDAKAKREIVDRVENALAPFIVASEPIAPIDAEPFTIGRQVKEWGLGRPAVSQIQMMHPEFTPQDIALFYQGYDYKGE